MTNIFSSDRIGGGPRFISHRGFQPMAPENSLPAFSYAALLGQWAIETDVRLSRDGVLVCCHDTTVDRTFDGEGKVGDLTWAELSRLRIDTGSRVETFASGELRMPLFSQYLAVCKASGSVPFIELKTPDVGRVLQAVSESGLDEDQVVISSSHLPWLEEARGEAPDVFIHHIFSANEHMDRLADLGNAGLAWNVTDPNAFPQETVSRAHEMGLKVCLRAGDTAERVQQMVSLGLDYIPTNVMHGGAG